MKLAAFFISVFLISASSAVADWTTPKRDPYDILGIPKNATDDDVKKAYRRLAAKHHPDRHKGPEQAAAAVKFKEAKEAYEVLSEPGHRTTYDTYGGFDLDPTKPAGTARPPGFQQSPPPPPPRPPPSSGNFRERIRQYALRPFLQDGVGLTEQEVDAFIAKFARQYGAPNRTFEQAIAMHQADMRAGFRAYYDFARLSEAEGGMNDTQEKATADARRVAQQFNKSEIDTRISKFRAEKKFSAALATQPGVRLTAEQTENAKEAFAIFNRPESSGGFGISSKNAIKLAVEAGKYPRGGNFEEQLKPVRDRYLQAVRLYEQAGLSGVETSDLADLALRSGTEFDQKFALYREAIIYASMPHSAGGLDYARSPGKVDEFVRRVMTNGNPQEFLEAHVLGFRKAYGREGRTADKALEIADAATRGTCALAYAKLGQLFK